MNPCARCGIEDRDVRLSLVNLAREAVRDGRRHTGPDYAHEFRCRDRDACSERYVRTVTKETA